VRPQLPAGLYAIADSGHGDPVELGRDFFRLGCRVVQLRCKGWSDSALLAAALPLVQAAQAAGALLIINDRVSVARDSGADGVHLGQRDDEVAAARAALGPQALIGRSTHTMAQVRLAGDADYLGFGPVFATLTKTDTEPVTGTDLLADAVFSSAAPIVAIGGINATRLPEIKQAGAWGWAVVSALVDPLGRAERIRALR
jgi:thiamine-phosphate pyrophosphorylase